MKFKRILSGVLAVAVVVSSMALSAFSVSAAEVLSTYESGDTTCTLYDDGSFVVSGTGAMADYSTSTSKSAPWNQDGNISKITSIEVQNGVTTIGKYAFRNCTTVTSITLSESVASILNAAFYGCNNENLVVDIKGTVTNAASLCFSNVVGTIYVYDAGTLTNVSSKATKAKVIYKGTPPTSGEAGENVTWQYNTDTKMLTISGTGAMYDSTDKLGYYAFYKGLAEKLVIEEGITSIGQSAFDGYIALENVDIKGTSVACGTYAFRNVTGTIYVNDAETLMNVSKNASSANVICRGEIPTTGKAGENAAWQYNSDTKTLTISGTGDMYNGSDNLSYYYYYKNLAEKLVVEEGITSIGQNAFSGYTALKNIDIKGSSVDRGFGALDNVTAEVYVYDTDTFTKFSNSFNTTIKYTLVYKGEKKTSGKIGDNTTWTYDLATKTLTLSGTGNIYNQYNVTPSKIDYDYRFMYSEDEIENFVFENGLTNTGGEGAVYGNLKDKSIILPQSITSIASGTFSGVECDELVITNKEKVTILSFPESLKTLKIYSEEIKTSSTPLNVSTTSTAFVKNEAVKARLYFWPGKIIVEPNLGDESTVVDKTALNEAITKAESIDTSVYTKETAAVLIDALAKAKSVAADGNAKLEDVTAATVEINDAIAGLLESPKVDPAKKPFQKIYYNQIQSHTILLNGIAGDDIAGTTRVRITFDCSNEASYNPYATVEFKMVIGGTEIGYKKYTGTDDTYATGTKGWTELLKLSKAIEAGQSYELTGFTYSWEKLTDYAYGVTRIEFIDDNGKILKTVAGIPLNYEALDKAIANGEAIDTSLYTDDSVKTLTDAIIAGKAVKEDADVTQDDVDAAVKAIEDAISALKLKPIITTATVTGTIKVSDTDDTTEMKVTAVSVDGAETTVTATSMGTYTIENLEAGSYTLTVSGGKYAPRSYEITVTEGENTQDVELNPYGDINGDGKITTADVGMANSHAKGVITLTDYGFICADVKTDGSITTADVGMINSHAKAVKSLW